MGELDKKKAELGFWEKVFFALFAAIFVVVAYRKVKRIIVEIGEL